MYRTIIAGFAALATLGTAPVQAQDLAAGERLYQTHCAYCHGPTGQGDGAKAEEMAIKPRNLTRLAADNSGVFPMLDVVMRIDGRTAIVAHGSPMPVFGEYFEGTDAILKSEAGQPILTSQPVADLVAWIESLQTAP